MSIGGDANNISGSNFASTIGCYNGLTTHNYVALNGYYPKTYSDYTEVISNTFNYARENGVVPGFQREKILIGSAQTTGSTATTILSIPLPDVDTAIVCSLQIVGMQRGATFNVGGYTLEFTAKNSAGTVSIVGTQTLRAWENNTAWTVAVAAGTNVINIKATGAASTTIDWCVTGDLTRAKRTVLII